MLSAARQRLGSAPRRVADEEDVVVVAFGRFLDGVRAGRFPRLNDRDDLWAVLLTLIQRTSQGQRRDLARQKRGGGAVGGDSALVTREGRAIEPPDDGPTPEEAAAWREELDRLLAALGGRGVAPGRPGEAARAHQRRAGAGAGLRRGDR